MEQETSKTRDNTPAPAHEDPTKPADGNADVAPLQQGTLADGGDLSSPRAVGGSKPDPVSTGPTVHDTIAGRNEADVSE